MAYSFAYIYMAIYYYCAMYCCIIGSTYWPVLGSYTIPPIPIPIAGCYIIMFCCCIIIGYAMG